MRYVSFRKKVFSILIALTLGLKCYGIDFLGFEIGSNEKSIRNLIGDKNIYYQEPFSNEESVINATESGKWIVQKRPKFVIWEKRGNWLFPNALSTTLAFSEKKLKEVSVYWQTENKKDAESLYYSMLHYAQDDYGKLINIVNERINDIVIAYSKAISNEVVVNLILRNIGNHYLIKYSAVISTNTEAYISGKRIYEKDGNYSYIPPDGWLIQKNLSISNFRIAYGPRFNDFNPTITFSQEKNNLNLYEYVKGSLKNILNNFNNCKLIEDPYLFFTLAGKKGLRITYSIRSNEIKIKQYYFSNDVIKTIITCGYLTEQSVQYDRVFDESIKTVIFY